MRLKKYLCRTLTMILAISLISLLCILEFGSYSVEQYYIKKGGIKVDIDGNSFLFTEDIVVINHTTFLKLLALLTLIGLVSVCLIVKLMKMLNERFVRNVMVPIDLLMGASQDVQDGQLDKTINYDGLYEFEVLCAAFSRMQQAIAVEKERFFQNERKRNDMLSDITHDLRTPLTAVQGYLQGILDGVADSEEKKQKYLTIALQKTCDMEQMIQQLSEISKFESSNYNLRLQKSSLLDFLHDFVEEITCDLENAQVHFEVTDIKDAHLVKMDPHQMKRILINLVTNSLKYAKAEQLELTLTLNQCSEYEILTFKDNGKGVKENQLPHLFDKFYRGEDVRCDYKNEGNGLGLYIVKYLIEEQGGTIKAENDHGLKFTIIIPRFKQCNANLI